MNATHLLVPAAAAFAVASALFLSWLLRFQQGSRRAGATATIVATVLLIGAIVAELGGLTAPTLGGGPRVLLLVVGGVCVLFLISRLRTDMPLAGPVIAPLAAAATFALAVKSGAGLGPHPVGASSLGVITIVHIGTTLLGFVCFLPAYILSVLFLDQEYRLRMKRPPRGGVPSLLKMEQLAWRLVFVGFPLLSVGILLGLVWSEQAGTLEPKPQHLLAVTAWGIYGYATARRLKSGWRGRRAALTLMAAFVLTLAAVILYTMR